MATRDVARDPTVKPELSCCVPIWEPWPSGWAWSHQRNCPRRPRQKVELRDVERTEAIAEHPAGGAGELGVRMLNPSEIIAARWHALDCPCLACEYMWEHADDDDDRAPEEAT